MGIKGIKFNNMLVTSIGTFSKDEEKKEIRLFSELLPPTGTFGMSSTSESFSSLEELEKRWNELEQQLLTNGIDCGSF